MKRMFLASSIETTGPAIGKEIESALGKKASDLKLVFINTAAEVEEGDKTWMINDRKGLEKAGFQITDYTITNKTLADIEKELTGFDVVHVNGGNTFYLLQEAKRSGFDEWLVKVVNEGKVLTTSSAGTQLVGRNIDYVKHVDDPSKATDLKDLNALGLVNTGFMVHWASSHNPEGRLKALEQVGDAPVTLLSNYQYLKVIGESYQLIDVRTK